MYGGINLSVHLCGAGMAFIGFSLSLIIGLWVNNTFITVVLRSLFVMLVFYLMGFLLAHLGQKTVQENFDNEREQLNKTAKEEDQQISQQPDESPENIQQTAPT